ncbi:MAG: tetratricopeptide repeat protein [Treponema sp.]|nr:tetratricopeptide repeat protein [Treponema sp.]
MTKKKIFLIVLIFTAAVIGLSAQNKPIVQDIQATYAKGTKINIYWTLPQNPEPAIKKLLVYRDTRPISSYNQLSTAYFVAELPAETCGYTDSVSDYNEYYYAVIAFTDHPYDLILVSMNSTVEGVHLIAPEPKDIEPKKKQEEKLYTDGTLRETPLPFINYVEGQGEQEVISDDAVKVATQFSAYSTGSGKTRVSPYFFEEDLVSPDSGDDFLLFEVLKTTFVQEKYEEAINLLNKLNGTNISESVRNRVYFYIAEAYFFTGDFEEAAKAFVKVAHVYPLQTKIWINYTLDRIAIPE